MSRFLLDTSGYSSLRRQADKLQRLLEQAEYVAMNVVALGELISGFLSGTRSFLRVRGRRIPTNDIWIAASALEHDLTVLTADRHFLEVPELRVELVG